MNQNKDTFLNEQLKALLNPDDRELALKGIKKK